LEIKDFTDTAVIKVIMDITVILMAVADFMAVTDITDVISIRAEVDTSSVITSHR
jgi:hypothetical protein